MAPEAEEIPGITTAWYCTMPSMMKLYHLLVSSDELTVIYVIMPVTWHAQRKRYYISMRFKGLSWQDFPIWNLKSSWVLWRKNKSWWGVLQQSCFRSSSWEENYNLKWETQRGFCLKEERGIRFSITKNEWRCDKKYQYIEYWSWTEVFLAWFSAKYYSANSRPAKANTGFVSCVIGL